MATARNHRPVPHSLRAYLERLSRHENAVERARGERLIRACEADDGRRGRSRGRRGLRRLPYVTHAAQLNGGADVAER
eukprot:scaffold125817_cov60-Phaeocystis_antarctica.AAC.1